MNGESSISLPLQAENKKNCLPLKGYLDKAFDKKA